MNILLKKERMSSFQVVVLWFLSSVSSTTPSSHLNMADMKKLGRSELSDTCHTLRFRKDSVYRDIEEILV